MDGGVIDFSMRPTANKQVGTNPDAVPYSFSKPKQ
jgi:hypothetical protein